MEGVKRWFEKSAVLVSRHSNGLLLSYQSIRVECSGSEVGESSQCDGHYKVQHPKLQQITKKEHVKLIMKR